ncbi:MAG TPA: hypothetical protein VNF74_04095 [Terriglobales bacterium]|nr:hypothetical protein [Terriglobales bacterium]
MSGDEKFVGVLQAMLEKARKDEIAWRKIGGTSYRVDFPASAIEIHYVNPSFEPDSYHARLLNARGESVKTLSSAEEEPQWPLLSSLYAEAERFVSGWDRALLDAEAAVASAGRVGGREAPEITDADIPF